MICLKVGGARKRGLDWARWVEGSGVEFSRI